MKLHGEEGYEQYNSEVSFTYSELSKKIKSKYNNFELGSDKIIQILEYTESGRVKTIQIGNISLSGVETRNILGLKSTNFEITKNEEKVSFKVIGYGHGVGMSQTGADALANQGYTYDEIIRHYYTGVEIINIK